jgi:putative ABC transport system ATP-binding protein
VTVQSPALDVERLRFSYPGGPQVLDISRLVIGRGERVFLRGPSGSGKSTLLGIVSGVLSAGEGTVESLGRELGALSPAERDAFRGDHIGLIFQMFNLLPYLSVPDNVLLPARFSAIRRSRCSPSPWAEAGRLLSALGLPPRAAEARSVMNLSIGEQQRVAVARALLGRPELVIADEPTSALDSETRDAFLRLLMAECSKAGAALLFVSHDTSLGPLFDRQLSIVEINRHETHA